MTSTSIQSLSRPDYSFKAYHAAQPASTHSKALGSNPALLGWLEDARTYYNDVMSGVNPMPDSAAWNEFLNQKQWAEMTAFGGSGGDDLGLDMGYDPEEDQGPTINGYDGVRGPNGWNYDTVQTHIGFTGDNTRNDVYGTDNTLSFDQPSAKNSFEITTDHGVQVLKVVTTTSTGTMVTYYDSWESADFKLNVLMADESKVSGLDSLPEELRNKIEVEKFDPNKKPEEVIQQSSLSGQAVEGEENAYYYEVESVDQSVDFRLKAGDNETHYVVGNSNISLPVSSHADVSEGPFEVNGDSYDYKIEVTHKDGSTDTIYTKKPFTVNVNAVEGYTTFNGAAVADDTVPESFQEIFTLNGQAGPAETVNERTLTDTKPDSTDGSEAIYNRSENVELHANFDDETQTHRITTPGSFTLHTDSYSDTVEINKLGDGSYHIIVYKGGEHDLSSVEIYFVNGASEINIDALPGNISGDASEDPIVTKSQVTEPTQAQEAAQWPKAEVLANVPSGSYSDWATEIVQRINSAFSNGNWARVEEYLNMIIGWSSGEDTDGAGRTSPKMNDAIRKVVTAIYIAAGSNRENFMQLLDLLPANIRQLMADKVTWNGNELDQRLDSEQWTSRETRNILLESLWDDEGVEGSEEDSE